MKEEKRSHHLKSIVMVIQSPTRNVESIKERCKVLNIITPELTSAVSINKVRIAMLHSFIAAIAHSLGHDISAIAVNRTSVQTPCCTQTPIGCICETQLSCQSSCAPHCPLGWKDFAQHPW